MRKAVLAYFSTFIVFISLTFNVMANSEVKLSNMSQEIHLKPWLSYQKLIGMQTAAQSYDDITYLWWLLRKAQAENFIYFYDDFNSTVKEAIELISNKTPQSIQSQLNIFQGLIYRRQGKYILSKQSLSKGLNQAKIANLSRLYIYGKQELAYTNISIQSHETSLIDLQEVYVEAFASKDLFLMASINQVYGIIYAYLHQFEKSIVHYKRAMDTYKHLQYPAKIAEVTWSIASTYRYWKKYDLAIKYYKKYQKDINYTPNLNENFSVAYGLAMTYSEKGDCEFALKALDRALQLKGFIHYDAELYKKKASCLITLDRLTEADEALFNAAAEFAKLPDLMGTVWQLEIIKVSGELNHARGNYELGYQMLKKYYQEYIKLLSRNSSNELLRLKNGVSAERQKITNVLEEKRSEVELLELENRKTTNTQKLYYGFLVFCILVMLGTIILLQYRNREKVNALTIKDPLSDLFNRRYIFDYLSNYILSSPKGKIDLAAILIDINDFKEINEKYGYPIGDEIVCAIANIGKQIFRQCDIFSRIGGEEFMCILPRTDIYEAEKVAQRFIAMVNNSEFITGASDKVTISIGVAGLCSQCHDATQLFVNANQALYQAKHLGNNQVNVFKY